MQESLLIPQKKEQICQIHTIIGYILIIVFIAVMGLQMHIMIQLMQKMTKNTFAMCNMTKSIAETPAACYL